MSHLAVPWLHSPWLDSLSLREIGMSGNPKLTREQAAAQRHLTAMINRYRTMARRVAAYLKADGANAADIKSLGLDPGSINNNYNLMKKTIHNGQTPNTLQAPNADPSVSDLAMSLGNPTGANELLKANLNGTAPPLALQDGLSGILAGVPLDPNVRAMIFGQFKFGTMLALQKLILWLESGGRLRPVHRPRRPGITHPTGVPPDTAQMWAHQQNYCNCPPEGGSPGFTVPCDPSSAVGCGVDGNCSQMVCDQWRTQQATQGTVVAAQTGNYGQNIYVGGQPVSSGGLSPNQVQSIIGVPSSGPVPPWVTQAPTVVIDHSNDPPSSSADYGGQTWPPRYVGGSNLYTPPRNPVRPLPQQPVYPQWQPQYPITQYGGLTPSFSSNFPSPDMPSPGMNGLQGIDGCLPCALLLGLNGLNGALEESQMTTMWNLAQNLQTRIGALPAGDAKNSFVSTLGGVIANLNQIRDQGHDYSSFPNLFANEYKQNMGILQYLDQELARRTAEPTVVQDTPRQPAQDLTPFSIFGTGAAPITPPSNLYRTPTVGASQPDGSGITGTFLLASAIGIVAFLAWRKMK